MAARAAWERQSQIGGEVGYQIRFDDQTGLHPHLPDRRYSALAGDDPTLTDTAVILSDEFHERNLLSDGPGAGKQLQRTTRPDLKIVMSGDVTPSGREVSDDNPILIRSPRVFRNSLPRSAGRRPTDQAADTVERILNSGRRETSGLHAGHGRNQPDDQRDPGGAHAETRAHSPAREL